MTNDHQLPARSVWWGWGASDADRHLSSSALARLGHELGVRLKDRDHRPVDLADLRLPEPVLDPAARAALVDAVGAEHVLADREARAEHAGGKSYRDLARARSGVADEAPDAVVLPGDGAEVEAVLRTCVDHDVAVVPFGGGTSVVGGVRALRGKHQGVVTLDLRRLNDLHDVDAESRMATLGAGLRAPEAEQLLAAHGLTLGHLPQSFEQATIGGFAATRSAGQASSGYGRFDDMVVGATVITPRGELRVGGHPGTAAGPSMLQLLLGSEGRFGVITEVTLRVRPVPEAVRHEAWVLPSFDRAVDAVRTMAQAGTLPDVCRVSDPDETQVTLAGAGGAGKALAGLTKVRRLSAPCLLIHRFEGADERTLAGRARATRTALRSAGAVRLPAAVASAWAEHRFQAPFVRDELMRRGVFVETMETATTWANLQRLHRTVRQAVMAELASTGTPGVVQCHISHVYETGASLYFTCLADEADDRVVQWERVKRAATEAIVDAGGTVTHHHSVGTDHRPYLEHEIGALGVDVLDAVSAVLDPGQVLNPEKLVPSRPEPAYPVDVPPDR